MTFKLNKMCGIQIWSIIGCISYSTHFEIRLGTTGPYIPFAVTDPETV